MLKVLKAFNKHAKLPFISYLQKSRLSLHKVISLTTDAKCCLLSGVSQMWQMDDKAHGVGIPEILYKAHISYKLAGQNLIDLID